MARQYGAPPDPGGKPAGKGQSYASRAQNAEPQPKTPDASPPSDVVLKFHKNAPTDTRAEDIHHTLGFSSGQAAKGDHNHRTEGTPLFDGVTITGAKGGNAALASVIALLVQWGAKDGTT